MARIPQREFLFLLRIRWLLSFWGLGGILPRNSRIPQREFPKENSPKRIPQREFLKENFLKRIS